jgi:hypothetical protein
LYILRTAQRSNERRKSVVYAHIRTITLINPNQRRPIEAALNGIPVPDAERRFLRFRECGGNDTDLEGGGRSSARRGGPSCLDGGAFGE